MPSARLSSRLPLRLSALKRVKPENRLGDTAPRRLRHSHRCSTGWQGLVRAFNADAETRIEGFDDTGKAYPRLTLDIEREEATHFNSGDLETGNPSKGLTGRTGPGQGHWRLNLTGWPEDTKVLSYIRTPKDGFLTAMHDVAPSAGTRYRIAIFNPASNDRQVSMLRLVNAQRQEATVSIRRIDDNGRAGREPVWFSIPAGHSRIIDSKTLESGGGGLQGALARARRWKVAV